VLLFNLLISFYLFLTHSLINTLYLLIQNDPFIFIKFQYELRMFWIEFLLELDVNKA